jgi:hypothetical protein
MDAQNLFEVPTRYEWVVKIELAQNGWILHALLIK